MNILHVLPDAELGGGHVNALRLAEALERTEDQAHAFLIPRDAGEALRRHYAGRETPPARHLGRSSVAALARDIRAAGRDADVIHAHGLRAALAGTAARRVLGLRAALLYNVRGTHVASWRNQMLASALQRTALRGSDAVVLVSAQDERINRERYGLAAHPLAEVIRNGVQTAPADDARPRDIDVLFAGG